MVLPLHVDVIAMVVFRNRDSNKRTPQILVVKVAVVS